MPHLAGFSIFFAIEPILRALHRPEFEHNDTLRFPVTFQNSGGAAAHDVLASVFQHGRARELLVFLVANRINHIDLNNYVGGHILRLPLSSSVSFPAISCASEAEASCSMSSAYYPV